MFVHLLNFTLWPKMSFSWTTGETSFIFELLVSCCKCFYLLPNVFSLWSWPLTLTQTYFWYQGSTYKVNFRMFWTYFVSLRSLSLCSWTCVFLAGIQRPSVIALVLPFLCSLLGFQANLSVLLLHAYKHSLFSLLDSWVSEVSDNLSAWNQYSFKMSYLFRKSIFNWIVNLWHFLFFYFLAKHIHKAAP